MRARPGTAKSSAWRGPSSLLVFSALATTALGCGGDDGETEEVAILAFTADPAQLMRGESSVLSWQVQGAERLRVVDDGGDVLFDASPAPATGSVETDALSYDQRFTLEIQENTLSGWIRAAVEVDVLAPTPTFDSAEAVPSQILAGQATQLRWATSDAFSVDVRTSTGGEVLIGGEVSGTALVRPTGSTTYVLTARGLEADATAMVTVSVGRVAPSIERFVAAPSRIERGEQATLSWAVTNATQIRIRGVATSTVTYDGTALSGSRAVRPTADEQYVLTATGLGGTSTATVTVAVTAPSAVRVEAFAVDPNPMAAGTSPRVSWSVPGATEVRISQEGRDLYRGGQRSGSVLTTLSGSSAQFTLTATGASGSTQASLTAYVHDVPVIERFAITPEAASSAGAMVVDYAVRNFSQLSLSANGSPVAGFPTRTATSGPQQQTTATFTVTATRTTVFTLEAASAAGAVSQDALFVLGVSETEPNDRLEDAMALTLGSAPLEVRGLIGPTDIDTYSITVPDGGSVVAETSSGPGLCSVDTQVRLLASSGIQLAVDDDDGVGSCSRIGPDTDVGAGILPGGSYYVDVQGRSASPYVLSLALGSQQCGNGTREAPEACDDGARLAGDGCNSTCGLEVSGPLLGAPGGVADLGTPGPSVQVVRQLSITTPGQSVTATVASPDGSCNVVDTRLELLDASGAVLVDATAGGPVGTAGSCGAVDPRLDRAARDLAVGTYYLRSSTENGVSGPLRLSWQIITPACGNGLAEARAGEQCDDGNAINGDGCSASCSFEGGAASEMEPNDSQANATPSGLAGAGQIQLRGTISPSGDDDVFSFEIPAGGIYRIYARTYSTQGQPTSCDRNLTDTRMYIERAGREATGPGTGEIYFNDDIDAASNLWCSRIQNLYLAGGSSGQTYYIRLQGWQDRGTASYYLDLSLTAF